MKHGDASPPDEVVQAIVNFNAGRDPVRLAQKYAKMAQSPFIFLRGTCHLFYQALPDCAALRSAPLAWCCGDLHFENFGSYKADNRLVYFDINDYDEAALAPATWDLVRLLASIHCGAEDLHASDAEAQLAMHECLDAYRSGLATGKALWVEPETSVGLVSRLLTGLNARERPEFLDKRTVRKGQHRLLLTDGVKAMPASDAQKATVSAFMARFAREQAKPKFFEVIDIAQRIAGTGSLGVPRFVVLVEGKGSPDGNYLLDIKQATPSSLAPLLTQRGVVQPGWDDEAHRIVAVQNRMQAVDHAFLFPVDLDGAPFVLKGLQPTEDRVAIGEWGTKIDRLKEVVATMGRVLAWDQLRASGRSGSASADALVAFAQEKAWPHEVFDAAIELSRTTQRQWRVFHDYMKKHAAA